MIVIIDSGHNELTKGKRSPDGRILEYDYTRKIALKVIEELDKIPFITPIYLDDDPARNGKTDEDELRMRIERVNEITKKAYKSLNKVLLLSIHLDASERTEAKGASVWISPDAGERSQFFAKILRNKIIEHSLQGNRLSIIKTNKFGIIHKTSCPAALVECAFMTNKDDVDMMLSEVGFNNIVTTLCEGILSFIYSLQYHL